MICEHTHYVIQLITDINITANNGPNLVKFDMKIMLLKLKPSL